MADQEAYRLTVAVEDTERALRCGAPTAPAPPRCVDAPTHATVLGLLHRAYVVEIAAAEGLKATSAGAPVPAVELLDLVSQVLALIPESPAKAALAPKVAK